MSSLIDAPLPQKGLYIFPGKDCLAVAVTAYWSLRKIVDRSFEREINSNYSYFQIIQL